MGGEGGGGLGGGGDGDVLQAGGAKLHLNTAWRLFKLPAFSVAEGGAYRLRLFVGDAPASTQVFVDDFELWAFNAGVAQIAASSSRPSQQVRIADAAPTPTTVRPKQMSLGAETLARLPESVRPYFV